MIGVLAIFAALCLKIAIYMVAFPELSIGLFFFVGVLFPFDGIPVVDPAQGSAQMAPFEVLYPVVRFLNDHVMPWHPALKLLLIAGCLLVYVLLVKLVHIKGIYLFQIAGVVLVSYLVFQVMAKGFLLDMIWSVVATILITILAAGLRGSVLNPSNSE
jgi:hypothetical protein